MTRLYIWLQRHPTHVDGAMAAVLVMLGLIAFPVVVKAHHDNPLMALPAAVIGAPVVWRRKYSYGVFWSIMVIGALQVFSPQPIWPSDFAVPVALYGLAAYRPRRDSLTGLGVCIFGVLVLLPRMNVGMGDHVPWDLARKLVVWTMILGFFCAPMIIAWVMGDSMQYRRAYYLDLEEKARRLELERDQQAQIAAATERARIARELHDVVAHNVSVMVVQAEGAAYAMDTAPENTRKALGAIAETGRSALVEMRRLLGVLRTQDGAAERAPQPGVGQLEDLLEQVRSSGLPVELTVDGIPVELRQGVALAAYRIVQESLTNARKHGGTAVSASVGMYYGERELRLVVQDDGRGVEALTDGQGSGLTGMRERVAMFGGALSAGPLEVGRGFRVEARLPYESAAAALPSARVVA
ncbi:sensor histidine kinase [Actinospica durhamensis]|uniref:histidine kinase n=1 Tax=Actinospica durhamensis TaxID=1508375 RepID=A0A941F128_9ACTN|nr:sensor histidine kinase [Actinospica durhamensis]MBR7838714.1 sensor histidine kinase [Actinospica durhamensis]